MKKTVSVILMLAMLLASVAFSASAIISAGSATPEAGEPKSDIVITPLDETDGKVSAMTSWTKTKVTTAVYDNKVVYELGIDPNSTFSAAGTISVTGLNVPVKDYNYILVECLYTGAVGGSFPGSAQISGTDMSSNFNLYQHKSGVTRFTKDTRRPSSEIYATRGTWTTLVIPIYEEDFITPANKINMETSVIKNMTLYMNSNGGSSAAPVYISSIAFSQDTAIDSPIKREAMAAYGAQTSPVANGVYDVRFIATPAKGLDFEQYSKMGFVVTAKTAGSTQSRVWDKTGNTVYSSVIGGGVTYKASDFGAEYISVYVLEDVPADQTIEFEVVPYLVTKEGERSYGISTVLNFDQGSFTGGSYFFGAPEAEKEQMKDADEAYLQKLDDQAALMKNNVLSSVPDLSHVTGTIYYVSNSGSSNYFSGGTSTNDPVKSVTYLKYRLKAGDAVLFERGGVWREKIEAISGVTYSNYGDMNKPLPVISGSAMNYADAAWTEVATNIWRCETAVYNVGIMAFDHSGVIGDYGQTVGKKLFESNNTTLSYTALNEDLEFFSDDANSRVYLYSASNPSTRFTSIEIGAHNTNNQMLFALCSARDTNDFLGSNITVDGLHFTYTGAHALAGGGEGSTGNTIRNCVFDWIGGSKMDDGALYGNAIQFYGETQNLTVENNWIYQVFDTGITFQATAATENADYLNIVIQNNLVEYCHWAIEAYNQHASGTTQNITVANNFCRYSGMGWGSRYRVEQHGEATAKNAGAAAFCSWGFGTAPVNFQVTGNIFDRSTGYLGLAQLLSGDQSIVFSGNTYIQIEGEQLGKLFGTYPAMQNAAQALGVLKTTLKDQTAAAVFVSETLQNTEKPVTLPTQSVTQVSASRKYFTGTTEKDPLTYTTGENIVFNLSLRAGAGTAAGTLVSCHAIRWEAHTDDGHSYYGEASGRTGTVRIVIPATGTGFVRLRCYAVDANGSLISGVEQSTNVNAANMFGAGINVGEVSQKWEDANTEPADFDEYWEGQLAALNQIPTDLLELTEDSRTNSNYWVYRAKIRCDVINEGEFVTGYITVPKNAAQKSLQIKLYYFGYGTQDEYASASKMPFCEANAITFMVFAHSMELGQDPSVYAEALKDYGMSGNESPNTSYFRGMILRDVQAVRFCMNYFGTAGVKDAQGNQIAGLNLWDGTNINVSGGSQGGFQAIAVTALVPQVNSAYYEVPWMCDVANSAASYAPMQSVFRPDYAAGLAYFDSVSFAKRISRSNVDFVILRAGLGDYVCPPSGIMALYDALDCVVNFRFTQGKTHGYTVPTTDGVTLDTQWYK